MSDTIRETAKAMSDLNMFYAIIALCESSLISSQYNPACQQIIKICKAQAQRCLRKYDAGSAKLDAEKEGK